MAEWVRGVTFPVDTPKFRTLIDRGVPQVIDDTHTSERWVPIPESDWIRSNVAAPLRLGVDTVGMIGLDSSTPNFYRAEHAVRLMTFADLAAAAMRHARLLSETQCAHSSFRCCMMWG